MTAPWLHAEAPTHHLASQEDLALARIAGVQPVQDDLLAILDAVLSDPLPSRQTDREVIEAAIIRAAAEHDGLVTAAWVRPLVEAEREVFPNMFGAVLRPRRGFLEVTDRHPVRNEGGSGNANKWSPVYRLVQH